MGTGRQRIPAVANLIGYYTVGLSLGVTLAFVAKLRILGNHMILSRHFQKGRFFFTWSLLCTKMTNLSIYLQVFGWDCLFVAFSYPSSTSLSSLSWTGREWQRRYAQQGLRIWTNCAFEIYLLHVRTWETGRWFSFCLYLFAGCKPSTEKNSHDIYKHSCTVRRCGWQHCWPESE